MTKEVFLEKIKKVNSELVRTNNAMTPSIYTVIDLLQEMNEIFKRDMVDFNNILFINKDYNEMRSECEKMVEYNYNLQEFINSDKHVYDAFKILYSSCYNGTFPLPSNEIMREEQKNIINKLFEERYILMKPRNNFFDRTITEEQYNKLKQNISKLNIYYTNSGGYINYSTNNNPLTVMNEMFKSITENVSFNKVTSK